MRVGIPKEIKVHEYRVGATPALVHVLVAHGHEVFVQTKAGTAIGHSDEDYVNAGATIVATAAEAYSADLVVKVKEPQASEVQYLREEQILFCYLHLAAEADLTKGLIESGCVAIAYETVTDNRGRLPLLVPMSEIAGRVSIQVGATALQMNNGGKGVLLGGVPGVQSGHVVVLGGGMAGTEAARMAAGLGARVTVLENNHIRLRELDVDFGDKFSTCFSNEHALERLLPTADLLIGAVLVAGKKAPRLVTRKMISTMTPGSVIVDIAIDQGGCCETSRPTTHDDPTYIEEGVIHYCVTNMPGTCSFTATQALTNVTGHYVVALADHGYRKALQTDIGLLQGLNVCLGRVTNGPVAEDLGHAYTPPEEALDLA